MVLPNSTQKQIFTYKIFVVKLPAMHCICYELEMSREKTFVVMLRPVKSTKFFNLEKYQVLLHVAKGV